MTDILAEIDRQDGIIECTPQNVGALIAEVRRLRADRAWLRALLSESLADPEITRQSDWWDKIRRALEPKP
jgi:hypothetical protein